MRSTVWKFATPLYEIGNVNTIPMPRGARVVSVGAQALQLCLWALVDAAAPVEQRFFAFVGTGHPAPADGRFLGTAHFPIESPLVLHVFEVDGP